jgi:hypothetical protein
MDTKKENPTASEMAKLRWKNVTPEQRSAHGKKMARASVKSRKLKAGKKGS